MKKIIMLLSILVFLCSCSSENSTKTTNPLDTLELHDEFKAGVDGFYSLPTTSFSVEYTSNSSEVWIEDGKLVVRNNGHEEDSKAILTAKTRINGIDYTKDFEIVIKGNNLDNTIRTIKNRVTNYLNYYLSESDYLPTEIDGIKVDYKVTKGNAIFKDNHLIKTENAQEKEPIEVEATINDDIVINKTILLLDEYYAYLLLSFDGEDGWPQHKTGDEYLYFLVSTDRNNWKRLNNEPIIIASEGTNRFRDPYIGRKKDGSFLITATEGFDNQSMYISESNDLINFDTKRVNFNSKNKLIGLDGNTTWAPEFIYNQDTDEYTIIYSDPSDTSIGLYAVDTKDFVTFSEPYLYLNTGYKTIDGNIARFYGLYYLFYKDERDDKKNIHYAVSNSLTNPNWRFEDKINLNTDSESEGPFGFHDSRADKNYLLYDSYNTKHTYLGEIHKDGELIWTYPAPLDNWIRHFSIIELTKKEYERLKGAYLK